MRICIGVILVLFVHVSAFADSYTMNLLRAQQAQQQSNYIKLVVFVKESCPYCHQQIPILSQARQLYGNSLAIQLVDVFESRELTIRENVSVTPTLIWYTSDGKQITRADGLVQLEDLKLLMSQLGY